jgi:hypothetical protein
MQLDGKEENSYTDMHIRTWLLTRFRTKCSVIVVLHPISDVYKQIWTGIFSRHTSDYFII